MLTAYTKNGKKLCLGYPYKKETLLSLRSREEFYCPLCGERVFLKLGDQKIHHFAHQKGGSCREFFENETEYHMEGKLKLYQWLKRQRIPAELEYFDRRIRQRPDILFYYQNRKYALEYQCSTISEQIFQERTKKYLSGGYIPLWVIGGNILNGNSVLVKGLTNFHYLFLRSTENGECFIPGFSPENNLLQILYGIFPYSSKKVLLQKSIQSIDIVKLPFLLEPVLHPRLNLRQWKIMSEKYMMHWSFYQSMQQKKFLHEIYNHHLNLFLFPPEIGVPIANSFLIRTPPFIWQAYYYLDVLHASCPGDIIHVTDIEKSFTQRLRTRELLVRTIPQTGQLNPLSAYIGYTYFFVKHKVLLQKSNELFQVQKIIEIPKSNREKEERNIGFYKQELF